MLNVHWRGPSLDQPPIHWALFADCQMVELKGCIGNILEAVLLAQAA